jgi:hypothetical protein
MGRRFPASGLRPVTAVPVISLNDLNALSVVARSLIGKAEAYASQRLASLLARHQGKDFR